MNPVSQTDVTTAGPHTASADPSPTAMLYAPIAAALQEVDRRLNQELANDAPFVHELLRYVSGLGGKRLRPALHLLTARATGEIASEHITLAAVLEMIHVATLIHDDVLDDAATRRHLATVNARWGTQSSVLLGDYLFTHAFYLASTLDSTYACRTIGRSTNRVCEGELRQVGNQGNWRLSESQYLDIIGAKTAELCACCCELGAHYAGGEPEQVREMREFGYELGLAFQIVDDLLDLTGEERKTGKSLGTDLINQKATLPVIHFLNQAEDRERWIERLSDPTLPEAVRQKFLSQLSQSGALEYARSQALKYAQSAANRLKCVRPSTSRDVLQAVTAFVVHRLH